MDNNGNIPRFDPMTGKPIEPVDNAANNSPKFDPMTGEPLQTANNTVNNVTNNVENATNNAQSAFSNPANMYQNNAQNNAQNTYGAQQNTTNQANFGGNPGFNQTQTFNAAGEPINTAGQPQNDYNSFMRNNSNNAAPAFKTRSSRGSKKMTALIVAAVLVIIAGVSAFAFRSKVVNAIKLHTLSPSKYYEWVMKKQYKKVKKDRLDLYGYAYDIMTADEKGVEGSVNAKAGKDLLKLVDSLGQDTKGLESVGGEFSAGTTKDSMSVIASAKLNDKTFVSVEAGGTNDLKKAYVRVPEVSDKFIDFSEKINTEATRKQIDKYLESASKVDWKKLIPSTDLVDKESDRYFYAAIDFIVDNKMVSKSSKTMKAAGVKAKFTTLRTTFDGEDVCDMAVAFLEEFKDDKDADEYVKQILEVVEDVTGESLGSSDYDSEKKKGIEQSIELIKKQKDKFKEYKNLIDMTVYVDGEGTVSGFDIEVHDNNGKKTILKSDEILVINGKKFGYEANVSMSDKDIVKIEGSGSANFKNTSGKFDITINDTKDKYKITAEIKDADTTKLLKGYFKGDVIIKSKDVPKLDSLEVKLSIDQKRLDTDVKVVILADGSEYGKVDFSLKFTDKPKEVKPEGDMINANDSEALMKEFSEFDAKKYVDDFMKDAGIDVSTDELESLFNMFAKNGTGLNKFGIGNKFKTPNTGEYETPFGTEPETDDYNVEPSSEEPSTEYQEESTAASSGDGSDIGQYDEKYWETYEFPSLDEKYWETYTFDLNN